MWRLNFVKICAWDGTTPPPPPLLPSGKSKWKRTWLYNVNNYGWNFSVLSLAVRALVLPKNQTTEGYKHNRVYDLRILKIYKGGKNLGITEDRRVHGENITVNGEIGLFVKAYTVAVKLRNSTVYFLAGSIRNETIQLNLGSWIQPWSDLTKEQRAGIRGMYSQNCKCQITPCFTGKADCDHLLKGCNVSQYQLWTFYQGCEWRHSYCLKNSEATACSWHETAAYMNCRSPAMP